MATTKLSTGSPKVLVCCVSTAWYLTRMLWVTRLEYIKLVRTRTPTFSSQIHQGRVPRPRHWGSSTLGVFWVLTRKGCEQTAELALLMGLDALQRPAPTENTLWFYERNCPLFSRVQHQIRPHLIWISMRTSCLSSHMKTSQQAGLKRDWWEASAFPTASQGVAPLFPGGCQASQCHRYIFCSIHSCYFNPLWQPQPWQEHPWLSKQICRTAWSW